MPEGNSQGNGCSAAGSNSFKDALAHIGAVHQREIDLIRQEYDVLIRDLKKENKVLRSGLSKAGISADDIVIDTELSTIVPLNSPHRAPNGNGLMSAAGEAANAVADAPKGGNGHTDPQGEVRKPQARPSIQEAMIDGEFRIKDQWTKAIEASHWNTDLYDFMVKYGSAQKGVRREVIANVAACAGRGGTVCEETGVLIETAETGCTIYPNSTFRLTWDLSGLVLISYDLITIPLNLAFVPDDNFFSVGMDWVTLLFWTADMMQGFFLGYFEKGAYVSDNRRILKHYLLTWFLPDLVVVLPEWVMTVASSSISGQAEGGVGEIGKILKGARAVRALRLLRLLKLQRIINLLYDMIESEHTFIVVNLGKLLVAVLVLNHVIACLWYLIGRLCMEADMVNWIEVARVEADSSQYKYLSSLHWSLTQFTPASMDISARNVWERAFSIVVLFFAMVAFSSIVASITGSMTSLRNMKTEDMKQFWLLRRYLRQRNVQGDLVDRIFKYLEHETQKRAKQLQRTNIKVVEQLSNALQSELAHALNSPFLTGHPFFHHLDNNMGVVMHRLCHICLKSQSHAEKEVIFAAGEKATQMYFIKGSGTGGMGMTSLLEYTSVEGAKLSPPPFRGEWVAEAVLWTDWRHQGELFSLTTNDLIGVDPASFLHVMSIHPRPWFYAKRYAMKFIKFLNGLESSRVIDILRDDIFYNTAVSDCDKIGDRPPDPEEGFYSDSADFSNSSDGDRPGDNSDDASEKYNPFTWRNGSPQRQPRSLGLCCAGALPCGRMH